MFAPLAYYCEYSWLRRGGGLAFRLRGFAPPVALGDAHLGLEMADPSPLLDGYFDEVRMCQRPKLSSPSCLWIWSGCRLLGGCRHFFKDYGIW